MRIRRADPSERRQLGELALRSKAHWGYDADFIERCRDELTVDPAEIEDTRVIERGGEVLGFYTLGDRGGGRVELEYLFVEPAAIGTGLGRALIEPAVAAARDSGYREMVIHGDPNAARFYRAAGAVQVGEAPSASIPGRMLPVFVVEFSVSR
jgi:GNAT superfamily N-acetyltransferase